jgi:hypothetical protein
MLAAVPLLLQPAACRAPAQVGGGIYLTRCLNSPLLRRETCLHLRSSFLPASRRYFWITDSCPRTVSAVTDRAPFEVLSLAQPIAAALQI